MTVHFYTFAKRANSTARPTNPVLVEVLVKLKDESGVLCPVLEIANGATWNPSALNYAWIGDYNRYYFVSDWVYIGGRWECSLKVDVLASWKTEIGALSKYILRSASDYNINIVDEFYPVSTQNRTHYDKFVSFDFEQDFDEGTYILGVANRSTQGAGAITYYAMPASAIRSLVRYMLVDANADWQTITQVAVDMIERAIYSPFDYIKSCKWFPVNVRFLNQEAITFGNYTSNINAGVLTNDTSIWNVYTRDIALPSSWMTTMQAKYRVAPYAHLYLTFNPFGIIELDPYEFNFYDNVRLKLYIDYISGDAMLQIFRYNSQESVESFVTQRIAKIAIDINLSAASIDVGGILSGAVSAVGAIAGTVATGGAGALAVGAIGATAGVGNIIASATPTASNSVGQTSTGARFYDGIATLRYRCKGFVLENLTEFGRPLMATRTINTLSGFVKCGDGECSIPAFDAEIEEISEHLTNGFYYE